jgi:release factor glutamine methyltransferase
VADRRSLLTAAAATLARAGVPTPRVDAELLLAHVLGRNRGGLTSVDDVAADRALTFTQLVDRRARREPLQHLTGQAAFRHVCLAVGPGVFVPRPETEVMTGWVVDRLSAHGGTPVVLELCTGSGAIAAALADEVPAAAISAVELDQAALDFAARNLAATGVRLALGDLVDALRLFPDLAGRCDAVVANPPYIPLEAFESVVPEARDFDPPISLWSGPDGLDAIRGVLAVARDALRPGGLLAFEHAEVQSEAVVSLAAAAGAFTDVRDNLDLTGRARFVTATRVPRMGGWPA